MSEAITSLSISLSAAANLHVGDPIPNDCWTGNNNPELDIENSLVSRHWKIVKENWCAQEIDIG